MQIPATRYRGIKMQFVSISSKISVEDAFRRSYRPILAAFESAGEVDHAPQTHPNPLSTPDRRGDISFPCRRLDVFGVLVSLLPGTIDTTAISDGKKTSPVQR